MLKDTFLRGLKATGKPQKHSDGGSLYLFVSASGGMLWRMDYRFDGKRKTLSFGAYPAVGLKAARQKREEAKELLAKGVDPGAHKQAVKVAIRAETENSLEIIAREWFAKKIGTWAESHSGKVIARLENDIFPFLGGKPISSISAPELLDVVRRIETREAIDTAHRALQNCGQVWRYAVATGRAERDITADLRGALAPVQKKKFASIKEPKAIGVLLRDIDAYFGNVIVRAGLRIAPYVFVRPVELSSAEWAEFDFEKRLWFIPAAKMKMRQMHIVPLARQVIAMLRELQSHTGSGRFLFPSMRANSAPISNMTLLAGLRRLGYTKEQMTMHGFRHMASTCLNEEEFDDDWIEAQLAHSTKGTVRGIYNSAQYLDGRREMMQWWADYLDGLRVGKEPATLGMNEAC